MSVPNIASVCSIGIIAIIAAITDAEICFKKYNPLKPGCYKELRHKIPSTSEECCLAGGQGYAIKLEHVGHKKKWFQCSPCPRFVLKTNKRTENEIIYDKNYDDDMERHNKIETEDAAKRNKNKTEQDITHAPMVAPLWTDWSPWGPCKATCGAGTQQRGRFCLQGPCVGSDIEERECRHINECPVDGGWGDWYPWEECSVSCGSGTQIRIRKCENPVPAYGGRGCEGVSEQSQHCERNPCPIHGGWSDWGDWSSCNVTCGIGHRERSRKCNNPAPQFGGSQCQGEWIERDMCITSDQCPIDGGWCEWGEWTSCWLNGIQTAFRACDCPKPQHGGADCKGKYVKKKSCEIESDTESDESESEESLEEESSGVDVNSKRTGCDEGSGDGSDVNCDQEPDDLAEEASYNSAEVEDTFESSGSQPEPLIVFRDPKDTPTVTGST